MIVEYFVTNSFGRIIRKGFAPEEVIGDQVRGGESIHQGTPKSGASHFIGGSFLSAPSSPSEYHKWSDEGHCWAITAEGTDACAQDAREKRDEMLLASDWTQLPDAPIKNKIEWANYRQALRDITSQPGFPETISWPEKP